MLWISALKIAAIEWRKIQNGRIVTRPVLSSYFLEYDNFCQHKTKTDKNLNPVPDRDELERDIEDYIFASCILLPIFCSVTQLISLMILLKSKLQKPKWGKQLTMTILFLIAGTSCIYTGMI